MKLHELSERHCTVVKSEIQIRKRMVELLKDTLATQVRRICVVMWNKGFAGRRIEKKQRSVASMLRPSRRNQKSGIRDRNNSKRFRNSKIAFFGSIQRNEFYPARRYFPFKSDQIRLSAQQLSVARFSLSPHGLRWTSSWPTRSCLGLFSDASRSHGQK